MKGLQRQRTIYSRRRWFAGQCARGVKWRARRAMAFAGRVVHLHRTKKVETEVAINGRCRAEPQH
jgi:hypothetical protein